MVATGRSRGWKGIGIEAKAGARPIHATLEMPLKPTGKKTQAFKRQPDVIEIEIVDPAPVRASTPASRPPKTRTAKAPKRAEPPQKSKSRSPGPTSSKKQTRQASEKLAKSQPPAKGARKPKQAAAQAIIVAPQPEAPPRAGKKQRDILHEWLRVMPAVRAVMQQASNDPRTFAVYETLWRNMGTDGVVLLDDPWKLAEAAMIGGDPLKALWTAIRWLRDNGFVTFIPRGPHGCLTIIDPFVPLRLDQTFRSMLSAFLETIEEASALKAKVTVEEQDAVQDEIRERQFRRERRRALWEKTPAHPFKRNREGRRR